MGIEKPINVKKPQESRKWWKGYHILICQQLWNEKPHEASTFRVDSSCEPLMILVWDQIHVFFNIRHKIQVMKRGVVVVDSIVLFVTHKHIINEQQL
jgi:hypothetical protein